VLLDQRDLTGVANLVSDRFPVIENGLDFQLVPWQPRTASTSSAYSATTAASTAASGKQRGLDLSAQNRNASPTISRFHCAFYAMRTRSVEPGKGLPIPSNRTQRIVLNLRCLLNRPNVASKEFFSVGSIRKLAGTRAQTLCYAIALRCAH
jgi:hypothetical protein